VDAKGRVTAGAITRILTTGTTLTTTATLVTGTLYPCDTTAGTFTVTLPNTSTPGSRFIAIRLSAGSNPVTINAATGQTVNGLASIQLTAIGQAVFMTYSNGGAIWQIIGAAAIPASATGFAVPTGGDLTGTYPAPTLAALSPSPAGTYGSASLVPVITTDSKGRVTSVTTSAPVDATKLPLAGGTLTGGLNGTSATFTGEVTGSDIVASGLTGATTATRYVGGTVNGAPASGTFAKGDFVIDQSGTIWVCTTAGTPGTWTTTISSHLSLRTASATVGRNETSIFSGSTASQTLTAPSSPIDGSTWTVVNKASVSVSLSFTPSMIPLGSGTGTTTYTVSAGGAYSFVNYNGSQWYMVGTNGADHMVDYSSVALSAWGAASSNVAMGSNKITGLADGTASTDAAAFGQVSVKANSAITLNTTAPLAGGGDLTADRTLSIADATTAVKGAVQLTNSTSSTSTTTAATPNSVKTAYDLANAALPLAGGTMNSGAGLNMNSGRILVLGSPGSTGDAARAGDFNQTVAPFNHYNAFGTHLAAWTFDPLMANVTSNYSSNVFFFTAIYIPFSVTVSGVATIIGTAGSGLTASGSNIGLFNATTCLAQTGTTTATNMFGGATGSIQTGGFVAPVTVSAGVYWIGHYLQFSGGASPFLVRSSAQSAAIQNLFTYPTSGSLTNLRAATYGSNGSGTFPATGNALPTGITAAVGDRHTFWALYI
jgi:hypothetical protein